VTTLDTSAIFTLLNRTDQDHERVLSALRTAKPPFYLPSGILAEIAYLIEQRLGQRVLLAFLSDLRKGNFVLDCGENDLPRVEELVARYEDLPLGLADALVIACAERRGGKVLSLDKHFWVVANEGGLQVAP
jgi:uncharacterized protein